MNACPDRLRTFTKYDELMDARRYILRAFTKEATHRNRLRHDDWIERERLAVVVAANEWAMAHGQHVVTVDAVERVEQLAVGHIDYATKLALYVAELACGLREVKS